VEPTSEQQRKIDEFNGFIDSLKDQYKNHITSADISNYTKVFDSFQELKKFLNENIGNKFTPSQYYSFDISFITTYGLMFDDLAEHHGDREDNNE
jgi:hypothetical protein